MTTRRVLSSWLAVSAAVGIGSFAVLAQTPAPAAPAGAPAGGGGRAGGQGAGRGVVAAAPGQAPAGGGTAQRDAPGNANADFSPKPPVVPKSAEEERKLFQLQQGYKMELVLAAPDIQEPAAITFDGNGRMYVTELRSYMNDADGTDTLTPTGRISRHEDLDNDGVYEKHTVFVDNITFPRFATPFGVNAILTKHSNDPDVWLYTDTNNDGTADKRELFTSNYGRSGNVEHQESFMTWGLDNWMYSTYNAFRVRWTPHGVIREPAASPGGAWGVTQDDDGKVWIQAGASGLPGYYQLPMAYGNFTAPNQMDPGLRTTWGAPVLIADMQPGMSAIRMPDGSLHSSTAGAGGDIFRGHRLPPELKGDYFYGEVVARIVRRVRPEVREGVTYIKNYYTGSEFIRQTDPLFRPVDQTTAPDGTMYIVDMYRGIIQESAWTGPGTYLRAKIEQYSLDKQKDMGRIWRLTHESMARDRTQPRMLNETPAQLVRHLSHENGWWRDTAQQLLVLKQDKSVVPALTQLARSSDNLLARFHAIWTLEGLGALDAALVRTALRDPNPRLRIQALRASESLYKAGDRSFAADYRAMTKDADVNVVVQAMLTLNQMNVSDAPAVIADLRATNKAAGVQIFGQQMLDRRAAATSAAMARFSAVEAPVMARGETIYKELCYSCHGDDGRGALKEGAAGATMAPPLAGSPRVTGHPDYVVKVLLQGLTGPINGQTFAEVMVPMGTNTDEWIAAAASYVRNSFGNQASFVAPADVARVRAATSNRTTMWTVREAEASLPVALKNQLEWKLSASHNPAVARNGATLAGWQSGAPQAPGMWFQVELPQPTMISEIQFESAAAGGRGGGGGRGNAAVPGAPPPPPPVPGFPRGYQVQTSMDGTAWSAPVAEGQGSGGFTSIAFAPTRARFIRITQTGSAEGPLSIRNLQLLQPPQ